MRQLGLALLLAVLIGSSSAAALAKAKVKAAKKPKRAASSGGGFGAKTGAAPSTSLTVSVVAPLALKSVETRFCSALHASSFGLLQSEEREYGCGGR